jgi:hypothetical protein
MEFLQRKKELITKNIRPNIFNKAVINPIIFKPPKLMKIKLYRK